MDSYDDDPQDFKRVRVNAQGRIVLPAEFRRALGILPGSEVVVSLEDDRLVIETPAGLLAAIQRAALAVRPSASWVDELIAERRAEARREAEDYRTPAQSSARTA